MSAAAASSGPSVPNMEEDADFVGDTNQKVSGKVPRSSARGKAKASSSSGAEKSSRSGVPSTISSANAARQHHLDAVESLDVGLDIINAIIDQLNEDKESGELTADISHLLKNMANANDLDALESMISVLDERNKPSLEYVLGVLGCKDVPEPLLERQRNQGQRAIITAIRNRTAQKRKDAIKAAKLASQKAASAKSAAKAAAEKARKEKKEREEKLAMEKAAVAMAKLEREKMEAEIASADEEMEEESEEEEEEESIPVEKKRVVGDIEKNESLMKDDASMKEDDMKEEDRIENDDIKEDVKGDDVTVDDAKVESRFEPKREASAKSKNIAPIESESEDEEQESEEEIRPPRPSSKHADSSKSKSSKKREAKGDENKAKAPRISREAVKENETELKASVLDAVEKQTVSSKSKANKKRETKADEDTVVASRTTGDVTKEGETKSKASKYEDVEADKKSVDLSAYEKTPREKRMSRRGAMTDEGVDNGQRSGRLRRESNNLNHDDTGALSRPTDGYMGMCFTAWTNINGVAIAIPFREPVSSKDAPGYYEVIKKPMDLRTVRTKLMDGILTTPVEFQRDLNQIVKNAITYNGKDSDIYELAILFRDKMKKEVDPIVEAWKAEISGKDVSSEVAKVQKMAKAGPRSSARYPSRRSKAANASEDRVASPSPTPKKTKARVRNRRAASAEQEEAVESEEERPPTGGKRSGSSSKSRRKAKTVAETGSKVVRSKDKGKGKAKEGGRTKRKSKTQGDDEGEPSKRRKH